MPEDDPNAPHEARAEHIALLNESALGALIQIHEGSSNSLGIIFQNTKESRLSNLALTKVLWDMGMIVMARGFRSTFRDCDLKQLGTFSNLKTMPIL